MARPFTGNDQTVEIAQMAITQATTLGELRQAQAVLLPLLYGLSLEQTAQAIGVSLGWACQLRRRFINGRFTGASTSTRKIRNIMCPEFAISILPCELPFDGLTELVSVLLPGGNLTR